MKALFAGILMAMAGSVVSADGFGKGVPMHRKSAQTYYVAGRIAHLETTEFMVDTGSSYTTINQGTLDQLIASESATYLRDLTGVLANGDELLVPIYQVASMEVGKGCRLNDIEVAVFPGSTRQILGLSTLRKASPFLFSVDPPQLHLSNCFEQISKAD
jgi:predicted aspartyl protease